MFQEHVGPMAAMAGCMEDSECIAQLVLCPAGLLLNQLLGSLWDTQKRWYPYPMDQNCCFGGNESIC